MVAQPANGRPAIEQFAIGQGTLNDNGVEEILKGLA
jgi:hypothetical protein